MKKALIIGAGFAGCTYAMMLRQKNWDVTVVEKAPFPGGGIRTFFHGGHPYTYGPHYLCTPHEHIYEYINKLVPLRRIKKINYSYQENVDEFHTFPIHEDDIKKLPDVDKIREEIENLPEVATGDNFEQFWINRVGPTLYERYVKYYNQKAWLLDSNEEMDYGLEVTVKRTPVETGDRYEFRDWYLAYPHAKDGFNSFFELALEGSQVLLSTTITHIDIDKCELTLADGEKLRGDILVSTTSPDILMDFQYGKLPFVGRDFFKMVLPVEHAFPEDVYAIFYPGKNEQQTRVFEYKKLTRHESPNTLLIMEVPSNNGRYYPTMLKKEIDRADQYLKALPDHIYSVGRLGLYRYIDMAIITEHGLEFRKNI